MGGLLLAIFFLSAWPEEVKAQEAGHLVISEVQIAGATANDEFIELYNPTATSIDLEALPLYLHIRNSTGTNYKKTLSFIKKIIPAKGFFLIAHTGFASAVAPDATYQSTSGNLVSNGAVYISTSATKDTEVIDRAGWASAPQGGCENTCASPTNDLAPLNSLTRKPGGEEGNGQDTDNNENDFLPAGLSHPQNSLSPLIAGLPLPFPDTTPPSEVTELKAVALDKQVELSWVAPLDSDLKGYKLYINSGGGFGAPKDLNSNVISTLASALLNGAEYTFKITTYDEKGNESGGVEVKATPKASPAPAPPTPLAVSPGEVVINEFLPNPGEEGEEWIELFNKSEGNVDFTGWWVEDGAKSQTKLSGVLAKAGFFVIKNPNGSLNNQGDIISLKSYDGRIIDQVAYGAWDDGNVADNAPVASRNEALAHFPDGQKTGKDINDFKITTTLTRGAPNIISASPTFPACLVIYELLPNPEGDDAKGEFIELKNICSGPAEAINWRLEAEKSTHYVIQAKDFPFTEIPAGGLLVIPRSISRVSLRNNGDKIFLRQPNGFLTFFVEYGEAPEGEAYVFSSQKKWVWTSTPTPGAENIITFPNRAPQAALEVYNASAKDGKNFFIGDSIFFDGSDSYDPDGDALSFYWELPGGFFNQSSFTYVFKEAGAVPISLTVRDNKGGQDIKKISITLKQKLGEAASPSSGSLNVVLNEIVPNPVGPDEGEWIEVFNQGDDVNLKGFSLDTGEGSKKPYFVKNDLKLEAKDFYVFEKQQTNLALKNEGGSVRLFSLDGQLLSQTTYQEAKEGVAWARDQNNVWQWTQVFTPWQENKMSEPVISKPVLANTQQPPVSVSPLEEAGEARGVKAANLKPLLSSQEVSLEKIQLLKAKTPVQVKGKVAVEPGILGKQIFYLAGSGVQIYFGNHKIPPLRLGDLIVVRGVISEVQGGKRINLAQEGDVEVLKAGGPPPPYQIGISEIKENLRASLVSVEGEVTEKKGQEIYLDDGKGEIFVYLKDSAQIQLPVFPLGSVLKVTGILEKVKQEFRILPRYQSDIEILENKKISESSLPPGEDKSSEMLRYLGWSAALVSAMFFSVSWRYRKELKPWLRHVVRSGIKNKNNLFF